MSINFVPRKSKMSSLSSELDHYELSQSLLVHSGAVRSVSVCGRLLLSAGFDKVLILSTLDEHGNYAETARCTDSPVYLYSTCFNSDGTKAFAGLQDGRIMEWDIAANTTRFFDGHTAVVCSLVCTD
jgi:WD40 repeat protein